MLYVLTPTPGLSSLGWSPTGSHTTWTTHCQNGDNLIYPSCTLGTYRGRFFFCASFALLKGSEVIPGVRSFPDYTEEILVRVPDSHELHTHTHLHTYKCTHPHTHSYTHTHTHPPMAHTHTHTHTYMHTHVFVIPWSRNLFRHYNSQSYCTVSKSRRIAFSQIEI